MDTEAQGRGLVEKRSQEPVFNQGDSLPVPALVQGKKRHSQHEFISHSVTFCLFLMCRTSHWDLAAEGICRRCEVSGISMREISLKTKEKQRLMVGAETQLLSPEGSQSRFLDVELKASLDGGVRIGWRPEGLAGLQLECGGDGTATSILVMFIS